MDTEIKLKWGKNTHTVAINPAMSSQDFKTQIQILTGVSPSRQKLLCPKLWKGALKDDENILYLIQQAREDISNNLVITLIGSVETLDEKPLDNRPKFLEDMTADEIKEMEMEQYRQDYDETDVVDITALQKAPGLERNDGKVGMYQYNRFVTGLPQHQINSLLAKQKNSKDRDIDAADGSQIDNVLAMTMGMELRKAYINSLAVLDDGTIVSGMDDGHVQLWRRCEMIRDLRHAGGSVDHVLKFPSSTPDDPAFISAGGGAISIWSEGGQRIMDMGSAQGTTSASLAAGIVHGHSNIKYLASCFSITRQIDPNQFRLVPQNEQEMRRRLEAEARENIIQSELLRVSMCIRVWFYNSSQPSSNTLQETLIQHDSPVTQLEDMDQYLVCGDERGCMATFRLSISSSSNQSTIAAQEESRLQLVGQRCTIVLLKRIADNILAVSISPDQGQQEDAPSQSATLLRTSISKGVLLIDMQQKTIRTVLNAHNDVVRGICPLPNGDVLTAGGKMDAKVLMWDRDEIIGRDEDSAVLTLTHAIQLKAPGYVFDLQVLRDSDPTSNVFAIAAARYNVIKIVFTWC